MATFKNYFIGGNDSAEVILNKLVRQSKAALAVDGSTTITGTSANTPVLGVDAWSVLKAVGATVIASLTSINPHTLVEETLTPTLADGEKLVGFFTAITLTSGSVIANHIKGSEAPSVPQLTFVSAVPNVADDKLLDITFSVTRHSGAFPPGTTEIYSDVASGGYSLLEAVTDNNGVFTYVDDGLTVSQTHAYKARYANSTSKGTYSNIITPVPDLPVDTIDTGTWVHGSLTGGFTAHVPASSLATDSIEIWGFANAAAVVANGALTLLATVHPAIDGATTYVYTKAYAGLDDSSDKTLKFQVRSKRGTAYGVRSAVLSVTAAD